MNTDQPVIKTVWAVKQRGKPGRPEHPKTSEVLQFLSDNPEMSQRDVARKFGISFSTMSHAIARKSPRCEHCGGKLHAKA